MNPISTSNQLYDAALTLFYPQSCAACSASVEARFDGIACAACWNETRVFAPGDPLCWKCGIPAFTNVADGNHQQVRCRRCDDAAFDAARACGLYEGALRASVIGLKRQPQLGPRLAGMFRETYQRPPLNCANLIVPVPLHPERERQRGFNQAAVLAHEISKFTRLTVADASLIRTVHTQLHRAGVDVQMRRESVENAFAVRGSRTIAGARILLVDDVLTTGATASACAAALKEAGAEAVLVLTVARLQENFRF